MSIRKDFPILRTSENGKTITYLDSAATTQKPTSVIAAVDHYYRQQNSNIHRAAHHLADIATRAYEHARELCRDYIGAAETAEIIFTSGTTASINLVAQALTTSVKPGQTIETLSLFFVSVCVFCVSFPFFVLVLIWLQDLAESHV